MNRLEINNRNNGAVSFKIESPEKKHGIVLAYDYNDVERH